MMKGYTKGPEDRVGHDSISSSFEQSKFAVTIPECLNAIDYFDVAVTANIDETAAACGKFIE